MTRNQVYYQQNVETNRSNLAREYETHRSNVANEMETMRANMAREAETYRSNVAREGESNRSNLANELLSARNISSVYRVGMAGIAEQVRSNLARELEQHRSNVANETERNRSNLAMESIYGDRNTETSRHNQAAEAQATLDYLNSLERWNAELRQNAELAALNRQLQLDLQTMRDENASDRITQQAIADALLQLESGMLNKIDSRDVSNAVWKLKLILGGMK